MELLSGPDLGGGFLFQLQAERSDGRARVTFHAQEGGLEAATPSKGPLTDLGFARSPALCPIGGRECFHREFDVPVGELSRIRMTYNRTRFVVGPSLEQRYGSLVPPVAEALREVHDRLSAIPAPDRPRWFLGGAGAAWLQAVPVTTRELALGVDRSGVDPVAEALSDFLIEPASVTTWPTDRRVYGARAFVGSLVNGVRVEWAVPDGPSASSGWTEWDRPAANVPLEIVQWEGRPIPVARLEFFVAQAAARREFDVLRAAARRLVEVGPSEALLEELTSRMLPDAAQRLRDAIVHASSSRVEA